VTLGRATADTVWLTGKPYWNQENEWSNYLRPNSTEEAEPEEVFEVVVHPTEEKTNEPEGQTDIPDIAKMNQDNEIPVAPE